jgi:hypothetical protein
MLFSLTPPMLLFPHCRKFHSNHPADTIRVPAYSHHAIDKYRGL